MGNSKLFASASRKAPAANALNSHSAPAYSRTSKASLAQYAMTGCMSNTFYVSAEQQLEKVLHLAQECDTAFLAKLAIYARENGRMKDLPAILCAVIAARENAPVYLPVAFDRVIDTGKMLSNFVQIVRSGVTGRSTLKHLQLRLIHSWFENRTPEQIFHASVGVNDPSLTDILRMVHPNPKGQLDRTALYGYMSGRNPANAPVVKHHLPPIVQHLEAFRANPLANEVPAVSFQMLTSLPLTPAHWIAIARKASWNQTLKNLNTFKRHGVLADAKTVEIIAARLRNREEVLRSKEFPYRIFTAYLNATDIPRPIVDALHDALEIACENVPAIDGKVVVVLDVSQSMHGPVTGAKTEGKRIGKDGVERSDSATVVSCLQAAALMAAAVLRKNTNAELIVFSDRIHDVKIEPRDSILTNATKLSNLPTGGTNCSIPIALLNKNQARPDLVIMLSDYESWCDASGKQITQGTGFLPPSHPQYVDPTALMREWNALHGRVKNAKLVCLDLQPTATVQAQERADIANLGGFSDVVFDLVAKFSKGEMAADHWLSVIEAIDFEKPKAKPVAYEFVVTRTEGV